MADIYGALICPHCLNCIHAVNDPEIGYACPFNPEWGNKYGGKKVCDEYYPDKRFIQNDVETFLERYKKEE